MSMGPDQVNNDPFSIQENNARVEGFDRTDWLDAMLLELETLQPGERVEITIPSNIDIRFFIAELGRPARRFEYGGIYNPISKSMIIVRGYSAGERSVFSPPQTPFVRPRLELDGKTTDDQFFHTHPWEENPSINRLATPIESCRPVGSDVDNVMRVQMIEEEDGFERVVSSTIGSRGFISITEAKGVHLDEAVLLGSGITHYQIDQIKTLLAMKAPIWTKNFAKDPTCEETVVAIVDQFFVDKRFDKTTSFATKMETLKEKLSPFIRADSLERLIEELLGLAPRFPTPTFLHNIGLNPTQILLVTSMVGVDVKIYEVIEGEGLKLREG